MHSYVVLLRGINVGGKNKVPMAQLKAALEAAGFDDVVTYIQSGNVLVRSKLNAGGVARSIEAVLHKTFKLDSALVKTLAIERAEYKKLVAGAPKDFGHDSARFRYNVMFLMDVSAAEAKEQIDIREGVDMAWYRERVVFFRNSMKEASKSRLSRLVQKPIYPSITIRNWNTTKKLLEMVEKY